MHVVKIDAQEVLSGSTIGFSTESQNNTNALSKRRGNTFFDDDYDEE